MKNKRRDIEIAWTDGLSNQHSIGNVFDLIMDNVRDMIGKREITKAQIRQHVDLSMEDGSEQYRTNHAYAIVEATLLALGWTIVDDDMEDGLAALYQAAIDNGLEIVSGEQAKRLRTLHEAREVLDALINETANKEPEHLQGCQPIETAPLDAKWIVVWNVYGSWYKAQKRNDGFFITPNGVVINKPTHWMPIPPLPENKK